MFSARLGMVALGVAAASVCFNPRIAFAEAPSAVLQHQSEEPEELDTRSIFRLAEVQKHGADAERVWVTRGTKVYDITEWIGAHPGGNVILRAAGGAIDKYWDIFAIHKKQDVYDILDSYCIGEIDSRDLVEGAVPLTDIDDPFTTDPMRDERLRVHTQRPCNAETPCEELQTFLTSNQTFFVRNHMWVPTEEEMDDHKLVVELPDGSEKIYGLADLRQKFKEVKITATLQCSGNRRKHMTQAVRPASGLQWDVGAISNAEWTGVRLRDVLADAGFPVDDTSEDVKHVHFHGAESYGASIPLDKAVDLRGDVLIAYMMNGQPLPRDHGFPIRAIVPGHVAARSVKWLQRVVLSEEESSSQWQRRDYKVFGPNDLKPDWDSAPAIQETPVQSAITSIKVQPTQPAMAALSTETPCDDLVMVEGYSYAGGGRSIVRVDVSPDDGKTWHQAKILMGQAKGFKAWSWRRWQFAIPKSQSGSCFVVKAVDCANNCQPQSYAPQYNIRGNLTTSWHRVCFP